MSENSIPSVDDWNQKKEQDLINYAWSRDSYFNLLKSTFINAYEKTKDLPIIFSLRDNYTWIINGSVDDAINSFKDTLKEKGWDLEVKPQDENELPRSKLTRYHPKFSLIAASCGELTPKRD